MGPMLAVLLSGGLFVTRHETLSASLAVACALAWIVTLCAAFRPLRTTPTAVPHTSA